STMLQLSHPRTLPVVFFGACLALSACGGGGGGGGGSEGGAGGSATAVVPPPATASGAGVEPCGTPDLPAQALAAINAVRASARACRGAPYPAVAALGWDNRLAQ